MPVCRLAGAKAKAQDVSTDPRPPFHAFSIRVTCIVRPAESGCALWGSWPESNRGRRSVRRYDRFHMSKRWAGAVAFSPRRRNRPTSPSFFVGKPAPCGLVRRTGFFRFFNLSLGSGLASRPRPRFRREYTDRAGRRQVQPDRAQRAESPAPPPRPSRRRPLRFSHLRQSATNWQCPTKIDLAVNAHLAST